MKQKLNLNFFIIEFTKHKYMMMNIFYKQKLIKIQNNSFKRNKIAKAILKILRMKIALKTTVILKKFSNDWKNQKFSWIYIKKKIIQN